MDNIEKVFQKNLVKYLKKYNKTQRELADYLNVSPAIINYYVKGINIPRMDKVDLICEFFRINRSDLLTEESEEEQQPENTGYTFHFSEDFNELPEEEREQLKITFAGIADTLIKQAKEKEKQKFEEYKNKKRGEL